MRRLISLLAFCLPLVTLAQQADPLIFREKTFDFGDIVEAKGKAEHEFVFTNNSGRPVKILSVQASCGCTTSGWTRDAVLNGKVGTIKASFDPKGRPGYFNKSLTVMTDLDPLPIVLQIKGQVITAENLAALDLPMAMGSLYFQTKSFNMGTVYINKPSVVKQFPVMNKGTAPVKFFGVTKPGYAKIDMPAVLAPNERGIIKITYDAIAKNQFGFASDNIQITTNDPNNEVKSISLYALLEEYYAVPTGAEAARAPVLFLKDSNLDLGRFAQGIAIDKKVMLRNTGKKDLMVKALQPNCVCMTAQVANSVIKPGDSAAMSISFRPQRGGTQQKAIAIYSNDPRNPVQRLLVQAYIEE